MINRWTEKEIGVLRKYYPREGSHSVVDRIERSISSVRRKARKLGVFRIFDKFECKIAGCNKPVRVRGYCDLHYNEEKRKGSFPDLTPNICKVEGCDNPASVRGYCGKCYDSKRHAKKIDTGLSQRRFTIEEIDYIIENYAEEGPKSVAEKFNRSPEVVRQKAKKLGLKWERKELGCKEQGCTEMHYNRGYCKLHHTRRKRAGEFSKGICKENNCNNPSYLRGYCYEHYRGRYNRGEFATEKCRIEGCDEWAHSNGYCRAHARYQVKYGVTFEEYNMLLEYQNGVCAICGKPETWKSQNGNIIKLAVDHVHDIWICRDCDYIYQNDKKPKDCPKCGAKKNRFIRKIRGLLCSKCNNIVGLWGDNLDGIMVRLKNYKNNVKTMMKILQGEV